MSKTFLAVAALLALSSPAALAQPAQEWGEGYGYGYDRQVAEAPAIEYGYFRGPHRGYIVDEYGFRYDRRGNRLDAQGNVMYPRVGQ